MYPVRSNMVLVMKPLEAFTPTGPFKPIKKIWWALAAT
jgi:hypothetical protein